MKRLNTLMQSMSLHTFFFIQAGACIVVMVLMTYADYPWVASLFGLIGMLFVIGASQKQDAFEQSVIEKQELVDRLTKDYSPVVEYKPTVQEQREMDERIFRNRNHLDYMKRFIMSQSQIKRNMFDDGYLAKGTLACLKQWIDSATPSEIYYLAVTYGYCAEY